MPTIITDGAASAQGYGFAARTAAANYIEDVFSTYLYKGNSSTQTITNGIDLAGKGGLVWLKYRSGGGNPAGHFLYTPALVGSGNPYYYKHLRTNDANAAGEGANDLTAFNSTGFSLGGNTEINYSGDNYVSWTFRKQAKFFDVVTYTGNGVSGRTISHNLGSVPGCIIVKCTSTAGTDWTVFHRSINAGRYGFIVLNQTTAAFTSTAYDWNPTSTTFVPQSWLNDNGATYVAYLFAHDAGGFGAAGTDNVISCGSFAATGADVTVNLGYEPQFIIARASTSADNWWIYDNMRGMPVSGDTSFLRAETSAAEGATSSFTPRPTSTGFIASSSLGWSTGTTVIYIAIRRGPMKTPTSGTSVFGLNARTGTGANATVTGGQTDDAILVKNRGRVQASLFSSRLTGTGYLSTSSTAAEAAAGTTILQASPWDVMDGVKLGTTSYFTNATADTFINYLFRRAPGFFDVVCYTGTGGDSSAKNHNLAVIPELIIIKNRSSATDWPVWTTGFVTGNGPSGSSQYLLLNTTAATATNTGTNQPFGANPTTTTFTVGNWSRVNDSGQNYVAYLFASCPGVSKVGSYTGNGTSQTINCGFAGGARFVLIKRTDSTGNWFVWDTARGIVAGNDPYWLLNSTAAEVTVLDVVDADSSGFIVNQEVNTNINVNAASYIFLAIA